MGLTIIDKESRLVRFTMPVPVEVAIVQIQRIIGESLEEEMLGEIPSRFIPLNSEFEREQSAVAKALDAQMVRLSPESRDELKIDILDALSKTKVKQIVKDRNNGRARYYEGIQADCEVLVPLFLRYLEPKIGVVEIEDEQRIFMFVLAPKAGIDTWAHLDHDLRMKLKIWSGEHGGHTIWVHESIDRVLRAIHVMGIGQVTDEEHAAFIDAAQKFFFEREKIA